ncbi:MAG: type II toxin-antitoxin system VapC family toxin [Acidobacteriota bacterium]
MSGYYFDSSALVKCYIQETGSAWVRGIINAQPANEISTALVTGAEIVAAISRRQRMNRISAADAALAIAVFRSQFKGQFNALRVTDLVVEQAMDLAEKHSLRGYDSIQLASALLIESKMTARGVGPLTFVSADTPLNQAAIAEGLLVEDPNQH